MQRDSRPRTLASTPAAAGAQPRAGKRTGNADKPPVHAAGQAGSLTAKMMEYRSWWNLPRSRSRKAHN